MEFVSKAEQVIKPLEASAVIRLDAELDQLQLKGAREFLQQAGRSDGIVAETDHKLFCAYDIAREA